MFVQWVKVQTRKLYRIVSLLQDFRILKWFSFYSRKIKCYIHIIEHLTLVKFSQYSCLETLLNFSNSRTGTKGGCVSKSGKYLSPEPTGWCLHVPPRVAGSRCPAPSSPYMRMLAWLLEIQHFSVKVGWYMVLSMITFYARKNDSRIGE